MTLRSPIAVMLLLAGGLSISSAAPNSILSVQRDAEGVNLLTQSNTLRLKVFSPRIIRVTYGVERSAASNGSFSVIGKPMPTKWNLDETEAELVLRTDELETHVSRKSGAIAFFTRSGESLLAEPEGGGKFLVPTHIGGVDTLRSQQDFKLAPDEAIYGLGQHAQGMMNYRGNIVHLQQKNPTETAVPVLISSRGYGVLWDNPAVSEVDVGQAEKNKLAWTSEAADAIDYYFMFGPDLDRVVAEYRQLTGAAPMFAKWVFGFWQSKARYKTQEELIDVVGWHRKNHVPLDGIVQDWQYWNPNPWGSHKFDAKRYPNPAQMVEDLHAANAHLLISMWAKFDLNSPNADELRTAGAFYPQVLPYVFPKGEGQWYDAFDPNARKLYWQQISRELFVCGIDGWWLDASEPELSGHWGEYRDFKTAAGPGVKVFNAYPLLHSGAVYSGQRAETSDKRVFILTRSAYAGQQRNGAVTWSGDIHSDWKTFVKQIPAGLNFSVSGIPYWTTDTGGFSNNYPTNSDYAELFTRWFQFSAFCPMFRVHGIGQPKEIWRFPEATQRVLVDYDRLRYHLLPYLYSTAWRVTSEGYTMLRPLVMDYRTDTNVFNVADQFQFGPALMVCPVTAPARTNRTVYLPVGRNWIDFWTGRTCRGGQNIEAAAPIQTVPLFVPAGSIITYGPESEYAAQKSDPIELRIYPGADGTCSLYEDEGDNYNYEKGAYSSIPIDWNEKKRTLTIGKRSGTFKGMLAERTFRIVWVSPDHGTGIAQAEIPDKEIKYKGDVITISAPRR